LPLRAAILMMTAAALNAQILKREPPRGALRCGKAVLVDDRTCPAGQIKQVIGGCDDRGTRRPRRCIAR
jgi:hypothetical protein